MLEGRDLVIFGMGIGPQKNNSKLAQLFLYNQ
jgi:hypothetical protein